MEQLKHLDFLVLLLIFLWVLPWKGWALWKAARNNHKNWFIVLLILNTFAILDILYIFVFGKNDSNENQEGDLAKKEGEENNNLTEN